MIKKGIPAIFEDEIEIKNIKKVFKISLDNNNIITFIISTINTSFILDYNIEAKNISLNTTLNIDKNDTVIFSKNILH